MREKFWELELSELSQTEWEALCDNCGLCCLIKLRDEDEQVYYTSVSCKLLNTQTGQCSNYAKRLNHVPDCLQLNLELLPKLDWLPKTCAYRLRYQNKPLADWHPLLNPDQPALRAVSTHGAAGRCVSEVGLTEEQIEERVVQWVEF